MPKNAPECAGTLFRFGDAGCGLIIRCSQVRILAGPFARVANGIGKAGPSPTTGSDPIVMTYWEAKEAGYHIPLLPSETGMRVCTEADFHPGFPSAEALEKSLREYEAKWGEAGSPGDCQVDPTKASIIFLGSTGGLSALTPREERPAP